MRSDAVRAISWILAAIVSLALWILLFALAGWAGCYVLGGVGVLLGACLYGNGRDRP